MHTRSMGLCCQMWKGNVKNWWRIYSCSIWPQLGLWGKLLHILDTGSFWILRGGAIFIYTKNLFIE
jgi:hypothetical protein